MDLIINGAGVLRSSIGARRYYQGVMEHLKFPGRVEVTSNTTSAVVDRISELFLRGRPDAIFWSACHRGPLFARNHVVTVLDCINVQYIYRDDWRLPLLRANFALLMAGATAIVTISQATRDAVLECFDVPPSKVIAIPGPTDFRHELIASSVARIKEKRGDFILMITNTLRHKNTVRAARALAASSASRRGLELRVVGSLDPAGVAICEAAGLKVKQHRGVDDATIRRWLIESLFLFSPSLQEGLNLPIGESLSLGGNVLCSDIPVHREFYDGAVLYVDPMDELSMTKAIDSAILRGRDWALPVAGRPLRTFSDIAEDYRSVFERVAAGNFST